MPCCRLAASACSCKSMRAAASPGPSGSRSASLPPHPLMGGLALQPPVGQLPHSPVALWLALRVLSAGRLVGRPPRYRSAPSLCCWSAAGLAALGSVPSQHGRTRAQIASREPGVDADILPCLLLCCCLLDELLVERYEEACLPWPLQNHVCRLQDACAICTRKQATHAQ